MKADGTYIPGKCMPSHKTAVLAFAMAFGLQGNTVDSSLQRELNDLTLVA